MNVERSHIGGREVGKRRNHDSFDWASVTYCRDKIFTGICLSCGLVDPDKSGKQPRGGGIICLWMEGWGNQVNIV